MARSARRDPGSRSHTHRVEVHWEKLAARGQGRGFDEPGWLTDVSCTPLAKALVDIAVDEVGREAIETKPKRVVVTFDDATAPISVDENGPKFEADTLVINYRPGENAGDVEPRVGAIVALPEAGL